MTLTHFLSLTTQVLVPILLLILCGVLVEIFLIFQNVRKVSGRVEMLTNLNDIVSVLKKIKRFRNKDK